MPNRKTKRNGNFFTRELQFPIRSFVHRTEHKLEQLSNVNPRNHLALVCDTNAELYLMAALRAMPLLIGAVAILAGVLGISSVKFLSATIWFAGPVCFCFLGHFIWMQSKTYIGPLPIDHRLLLGAYDCFLVALCVASIVMGFVELFK